MRDHLPEEEHTWKGLFPSVFDPVAEYRPVFHALGNEGGRDDIEICWWRGQGRREAVVVVSTAPWDCADIDVIEEHQTWIWAVNRAALRAAYSLARDIAGGKLLPAQLAGMDEAEIAVRGIGGICISPSRHHIAEAA